MMFYDMIVACEKAKTKAEMLDLLLAEQGNYEVRELFRLMLDKSIIYNIKKIPEHNPLNPRKIVVNDVDLVHEITLLLKADLRGDNLKRGVQHIYIGATVYLREVFKWVLDRQNPAKIGKTMVNKVWPGLIRVQEYMGAVPGTVQALENLPWSAGINVQHKIDGMTLIVHYNNGNPVALRTRAGQDITKYFPAFLKSCTGLTKFTGTVHHEALVWDSESEVFLDRQTGNGLINKAVKNGTIGGSVDYSIHSTLLDLRDYDNLQATQEYRYSMLRYFVSSQSKRVHQTCIYKLSEAREYAKKLIREGFEGVICKSPREPFKQGKPVFNVKIKNEFEVELLVLGYTRHSNKSDMIGALKCESHDSILKVNVGSGLSDFQRCIDGIVHLGEIITVRASEVIRNKKGKPPSLYLPRFIEIRDDKDKADTYQEIKDQEQAAKEAN